ncbi:MFS transporter [Flavobacterium hercynium]|uniref:Uncharacterized protein n=1 Tax=Flavobacterium hercynium TaxID=387094 RepID=A0A226GYY1_9FLAO|nr:hypothetical protein [Flavobacterium hercynium]OXA86778.1 hypothetical protein B0A66_17410 [Flavobacterium hercynium]SMP26953.1 hypothetical protein SAMN06265346_11017 [Flavobacterium hercynium]
MDKKTKFFKNVILFQFVAVLLFGVLILLNFRDQKLLNIRGLHPYEFRYGCAVPLIIFIVCSLLALVAFFSKEKKETVDEIELQKIKRQKNFWKFAFYTNVFFVLAVAFMLWVVFKHDPFVIDQIKFFYFTIFLRSFLVIILSLIVACFLLVTGIYWKSNKAMAIVIMIITLFSIAVSFVYEIVFVTEFKDSSDIYITHKNENDDSGYAGQATEEDFEESYVEEDDSVASEESKLLSSWNSLITDWGGLEGKNDFFDVRFLIGRSLNDHIVQNDYYYLVEYIDKLRENPNALYSGFEDHKELLFNTISPKVYRMANFDKIVDGLLLTYEDLGGEDQKLNKLYNMMNVTAEIKPDLEMHYSNFEQNFSLATLQKLKNFTFTNGSQLFETDIIWFYSFWARRQHEGNKKEIATILNEIQKHYNQPILEE